MGKKKDFYLHTLWYRREMGKKMMIRSGEGGHFWWLQLSLKTEGVELADESGERKQWELKLLTVEGFRISYRGGPKG